jgi:tetratricopeptide (TPR) repeat protein
MRLTLALFSFLLFSSFTPVCAQRYAEPGGAPSANASASEPCKNCSKVEMSGIDPGRLLSDPATKKVLPLKAQAAARKPAHRPVKRHYHKTVSHQVVKNTTVASQHAAKKKTTVAHHVAKPPSPCDVVFNKFQSLISAHKDEEADRFLKNSLAEDPQNKCIRTKLVKYLLCQGYFHMKSNEVECGARRLREVLFVDPRNPTAICMLDKCYAASGIDPSDTNQMRKMASMLLNQGRDVGAFVEYERLLEAGPDAQTYLGYGRSALKLGQNSIALNAFQQALKLDPYDNNAWRDLGQLQMKMGNLQEAQNSFGNALQIEPADILAGDALVNLAQCQLAKASNDPSLHLALAKAWMLVGKPGAAAGEFQTINNLTGNAPAWQRAIANARSQASQWEQQAASIKQIRLNRKNQMAAENFEKLGPSPVSRHLRNAAASLAESNCPCN